MSDRRLHIAGKCLLAIAVLWLIAGLTVPTVIGAPDQAPRQKAQTDLYILAAVVRLYRIKHHHEPSWADLVTPDADGHSLIDGFDVMRDPWGHAYVLAPGGSASTTEIRCLGPDGVEGTEDDLVAQAR
jgi:general secretion pathway protein G